MSEKIFHHAMSYVDDDIVENFLDNKSKRQAIAPSRFFLKWGAVAAVFCIAVATSFVMLWQSPGIHPTPTVPTTSSSTESSHTVTPESSVTPSSNQTPNSTKPNSTESNFTLPVPIDEIVWNENNGGVSGEAAWMGWNGMKLSIDLEIAVSRMEQGSETNQYLAIHVWYEEGELLDCYVYAGKSYAEHQEEMKAWQRLLYKYNSLAGEADLLKYGELLYTEGLPDGRKWTKEKYDERVAYYGEEFLSEYIVDGVYNSSKLGLDRREIVSKIDTKEKLFTDLIQSFQTDCAPEIAKAFEQYAVTVKNNCVYLFITLSEFETIDIENKEGYMFYWASRAAYDGYVEPADLPVLDNTVTGFNWEKIGFSSLKETTNGQPLCDEDVIDMIYETMDLWKYTYDYLEFRFSHNGELTEADFENMQYQEIFSYKYPTGTMVSVKYEDINLEALKELSQRSEITWIWIGAPLIAVPD